MWPYFNVPLECHISSPPKENLNLLVRLKFDWSWAGADREDWRSHKTGLIVPVIVSYMYIVLTIYLSRYIGTCLISMYIVFWTKCYLHFKYYWLILNWHRKWTTKTYRENFVDILVHRLIKHTPKTIATPKMDNS